VGRGTARRARSRRRQPRSCKAFAKPVSGRLPIARNTFTGHTNAAIIFVGPAGSQERLKIERNELQDDAPIILAKVKRSEIEANSSVKSKGSGIFFGGDVTDVSARPRTARACAARRSSARSRTTARTRSARTRIARTRRTTTRTRKNKDHDNEEDEDD
jgi:hypothetical protein